MLRVPGKSVMGNTCLMIQMKPMPNPRSNMITISTQGGHKILGVYWDVPSDQFLLNFEELAALAAKIEPTKRNGVSVVSRFYDSLGLVTPITEVLLLLATTRAKCVRRRMS